MRQSTRGLHIAVLVLGSSCCAGNPPPPYIDLLREMPAAERRAVLPVDEAIRVDVAGAGGDLRPAIVMTAPARLTWSLRFPAGAHLRTAVALVADARGSVGAGATARIGLSDGRSYDPVLTMKLEPPASGASAWHPIDLDLRAYSGWQWSVFYRPSAITWLMNLSVDATPGGSVAWARPTIQ
jgi:hypothetical protein